MANITIADLETNQELDKAALSRVAGGMFLPPFPTFFAPPPIFFAPPMPTFLPPPMPFHVGPFGFVGGHPLYNNAATFNPGNPFASSLNAGWAQMGQVFDAGHDAAIARIRS